MLDMKTWQKMHKVLAYMERRDYGYHWNGPYTGDPYRRYESNEDKFERALRYARSIWELDEYTVRVYRWFCGQDAGRGAQYQFPAYWTVVERLEAHDSRRSYHKNSKWSI